MLTVLAASAPTFGVVGFKTYTAFREGMRYVVMLFSAQNGELLAIIEADHLGAMRTGGYKCGCYEIPSTNANARNVGLIGAGQQAVTQLMGVCEVRPITSVRVYSRKTA